MSATTTNRSILLFALSLAVAACAGKPAESTTPSAPAAAAPAAGTPIELGEITVFEGKDAMLKIHADGTTELGGHTGTLHVKPGETASTDSLPITYQLGPILKPDGSVIFKGQARAKISADGTVQDLVHATKLPIQLTAEKATLQANGRTFALALSADGQVTLSGGDGKPDKPLRVDGADTQGKRRTVLAVLSLMLMPHDKGQVDPDSRPQAETPAQLP